MSSLRQQKRLIALFYHTAIFVIYTIGVDTQNHLLISLGIFDLLTFKIFPIVRFIQKALITTTYCPSCQKPISLVDCWECGCGYASHAPRHLFSPCQHCGKQFAFITCPRCDATILA